MTIRRSAVKAGRSLCSAFYFRTSKGWNSPYINHFISADTVVASYANPQDLNRFSYVNDNPLRYTDPTGHAYCDLINSQNKEDCNAGEWRIATSDVLHAHHKKHITVNVNAIVDPLAWEHIAIGIFGGMALIGTGVMMIRAGVYACGLGPVGCVVGVGLGIVPGVLAVPGGLIVMYGGVKFTEKYLNDVFVVTP